MLFLFKVLEYPFIKYNLIVPYYNTSFWMKEELTEDQLERARFCWICHVRRRSTPLKLVVNVRTLTKDSKKIVKTKPKRLYTITRLETP